MAGEDRTEKPTQKRRDDARKQGQVAHSADLGGALVLVAGVVMIAVLGASIAQSAGDCMRAMLADISHPQLVTSAAGMHSLLDAAVSTIALTVGPIAGACLLAALLGGVAQVGMRPRLTGLKVDFKKLNPATGAKNIFGPNAAFETAKAVSKVAIVAAVAAISLLPDVTSFASKVGMPPGALGALAGSGGLEVAERAGFAYLLIGVVDYAWQRRRHERQLKMSKEEVKEELRQHGPSPEMKAALRRRQMQAARARMMAAVPHADVVVTNPTHFAVALSYDGGKPAPEVLAKGKDLIAAQIRKVAAEHGVPIVPDPPLARALYGSTEIGQVIPAELYVAVARVLAFVYRMAGRSAPRRAA